MDCIQIAALLGLLLSFPAIYVASKRMIKERDALSGVILFMALFFGATLISSYFKSKIFIDTVTSPGISMKTSFSPRLVAGTLFLAALAIDAILYIIAKYTFKKNLGKTVIILLVLFVGVNFMAGVVGALFFHISVDKGFFYSCCASMGISGLAWGLTYEEICVIGNIYMQLAILLGSALYVAYVSVKRYHTVHTSTNSLIMICGIIYALIYVIFSGWVISHYAMPLNDAFYLCVNELVSLAIKYHTTYSIVNYVIFIIGFLILTVGNIILAVSLNKDINLQKISPKAALGHL